jgi:predicted transcriptional regulator
MATLENGIIGLELISEDHSMTVEDDKQIELIAKALSSKTRREILTNINIEPMDVSRIAKELKMTEANISAQIKKLEEAGLIQCDYSSGQHGVRKISRLKYDRMILNF